MAAQKTGIFFTDLDGTLHFPALGIPETSRHAMQQLQDSGVATVLATGRAWAGVLRTIGADFPVDYVLFSSGAGIVDWKRQELIYHANLPPTDIEPGIRALVSLGFDFMVLETVGRGNHFFFHRTHTKNPDFERRIDKHLGGCDPLSLAQLPKTARQFLVIVPGAEAERAEALLRQALPALSLVKATSPLDGVSIWFELFAPRTSKGHAASWLAAALGVAREATLAIGNDYNDCDLLEWAGTSFVICDSPLTLRARFESIGKVPQDGVSEAISRWTKTRALQT